MGDIQEALYIAINTNKNVPRSTNPTNEYNKNNNNGSYNNNKDKRKGDMVDSNNSGFHKKT
ncbi:hypothetical protein, partial [Salmonella enterica]|uniref:hypothetical protein n=1 Tax=Salmonella enterica TaxID=28901 RepID=UPI0032967D5E